MTQVIDLCGPRLAVLERPVPASVIEDIEREIAHEEWHELLIDLGGEG